MNETTNTPVPARWTSARRVIREASTAALATLDPEDASPYASLVTVATALDATPIILVSELAIHRRNLEKDPRVSLLFDGTSNTADPLQGARVSVSGVARVSDDESDRRRFLARHPGAFYADFEDFAFFRVVPKRAHFVGGFGKIHAIDGADVIFSESWVTGLSEAEPGILEHMNEDHADAVALYATLLKGAEPGGWQMIGFDPEGADLSNGKERLRIDFPELVKSTEDARSVLADLARSARSRAAD